MKPKPKSKGHPGLGVVFHVDGDGIYSIEGRFNEAGLLLEVRIRIR